MSNPDTRQFVFDNLTRMVIKRTNQSGGYGMVMGNKVTDEDWAKAKKEIEEIPQLYRPANHQSVYGSCFIDGKFEGRHVIFVLMRYADLLVCKSFPAD
jgi:uncharacterized circularly permuted ATP-grasp superfamily protein